ncbi:MAG: hypothetical protein M3256_17110 [Actinomycetota bacterium]|nr:hypothetical protein [Actinomycetota bacterium]
MIGRAVVVTAVMAGLAPVGALVPAAWSSPASRATAPTVAKAGTYHYRQTSPAASPAVEGTLVVRPAGSRSQTWIRNVGPKAPVSTSVMSYRGAGMYVVSESEQMSGTTVSCHFASPLPWPPSPPTVGVTFSGHAGCTQGAVLTVSGKIAGTAVLPLDGKAVTTAVVDSAAVMSVTYLGTRYEVDVTQVDWYAPSLRMPIQTATHVVIPAQGSTTDTTYVLESSKPS